MNSTDLLSKCSDESKRHFLLTLLSLFSYDNYEKLGYRIIVTIIYTVVYLDEINERKIFPVCCITNKVTIHKTSRVIKSGNKLEKDSVFQERSNTIHYSTQHLYIPNQCLV